MAVTFTLGIRGYRLIVMRGSHPELERLFQVTPVQIPYSCINANAFDAAFILNAELWLDLLREDVVSGENLSRDFAADIGEPEVAAGVVVG